MWTAVSGTAVTCQRSGVISKGHSASRDPVFKLRFLFCKKKKCHLANGFSCDTGYSGTLEIFGILAIPANLAIPVEMSGFCWDTGYFILFFINFYFAIFILFWNFLRLENWRLEIRCQRKIGMKGSHFTRNFTELTMS